jgi:hypothetical protein
LNKDAAELERSARALGLHANKARSAQKGAIQSNEDPQIRDYANKHFGGDYQKALIEARKTGYKK